MLDPEPTGGTEASADDNPSSTDHVPPDDRGPGEQRRGLPPDDRTADAAAEPDPADEDELSPAGAAGPPADSAAGPPAVEPAAGPPLGEPAAEPLAAGPATAGEPVVPVRPGAAVLFMPPAEPPAPPAPAAVTTEGPAEEEEPGGRRRRRSRRGGAADQAGPAPAETETTTRLAEADNGDGGTGDDPDDGEGAEGGAAGQRSRRRGRRGRGRGRGTAEATSEEDEPAAEEDPEAGDEAEEAAVDDEAEPADGEAGDSTVRRRRRKRRRRGSGPGDGDAADDGVQTVVKVREPRAAGDEVRGVTGSTRLEAKRQRRRGGRDQRRTRPPVLSEAEFLARREAVDRVMVIRQTQAGGRAAGRTQIAVLEDGVLVEHYVSRASSTTMAGSVYLGKVQNVLPSMEAAFVDVGRGRNAVLYAGEVNWEASGLEGRSRSIEQALSSGDTVLVQVTKDPVGHKGARLTSNIALSGRHLVYTPYGNASGISRKLPDTERRRLREILKNVVPEGAGVIVRTAAEAASAEELARDVKRLQAQWEDIQAKAASSTAPALLYSEPDLVVRVVRDLFNEDFRELVIEGEEAYGTVEAYLSHVSPDLVARMRRHTGTHDVFATYRIDEQILKGLDRKVYLPSGGHLVFDRTEAMTVIDVNTGKYTGTGGNLEETVTRNNLEAAEEIVRQLRLRDIGGIIVIDFIDMVLESNRELVLRRLTECLGRDRTKHQVTEITSLGLVQMTRKRVGAGLLEAFSEPCEACKGRGVVVHTEPLPERPRVNDVAERVKEVASASANSGRRRGRRNGDSDEPAGDGTAAAATEPDPAPAAAPVGSDPGAGSTPATGGRRAGSTSTGAAGAGAGAAGAYRPGTAVATDPAGSPAGEEDDGLAGSVFRRFRRGRRRGGRDTGQ